MGLLGQTEFELAQNLLGLVGQGFADAGVGLPDTQYVAPGSLVAYDEEQLTVNLVRIFGGQPGNEKDIQQPGGATDHGCELQVALVRYTPVVDDSAGQAVPPTVDAMQASAEQHFLDARTMRNVLSGIRTNYTLVDRGIQFSLGPVTTQGPNGGVIGTVATVMISVL